MGQNLNKVKPTGILLLLLKEKKKKRKDGFHQLVGNQPLLQDKVADKDQQINSAHVKTMSNGSLIFSII